MDHAIRRNPPSPERMRRFYRSFGHFAVTGYVARATERCATVRRQMGQTGLLDGESRLRRGIL